MQISLPLESLFILYTLQKNGYEGYIVGGAVRDVLLAAGKNATDNNAGTKPKDQLVTDYDFTTNALPEQIQALLPESFYENTFGTVSIAPKHIWELMGVTAIFDQEETTEAEKNRVIELEKATKVHASLTLPTSQKAEDSSKKNYEITTYRSDGTYQDHRRPESVTWGKTLEEDLSRRDFTINAMALQISQEFLSKVFSDQTKELQTIEIPTDSLKIIDLFGGMHDLENSIIRPVGNPTTRFQEDALRMLRAIRFSVQLNMKITDDTFQAVSQLSKDIQHVSWERIRDEFLKMLASEYAAEAIEMLDETGLLEYILPELQEGKGVVQGGHHTTDVWTHSLDALHTCPSQDPIVRFATLIHDIAKPRTFKVINGQPTFYNHEIIGSRMAKSIAQRFRLSKDEIERIFILVRYHMFYYQPEQTDAAIRRFMRKVGLQNINDILDLREGDRLGSGARKTSWRLEEMKQRMIDQLHQPFSVTDLAINGHDLMSKLNLQPGPILGKILNALFEKVLDQPEMNTKEILLREAKNLISDIEK